MYNYKVSHLFCCRFQGSNFIHIQQFNWLCFLCCHIFHMFIICFSYYLHCNVCYWFIQVVTFVYFIVLCMYKWMNCCLYGVCWMLVRNITDFRTETFFAALTITDIESSVQLVPMPCVLLHCFFLVYFLLLVHRISNNVNNELSWKFCNKSFTG